MFDKVLDVVKNKDMILPRLLLFNYKDMGITDQELIVLIYLLNNLNTYNPRVISDDLKIELVDVLTLISSLNEKGIITLEMVQRGNKKSEAINLDPLYNKLTFIVVNEEEKKDTSIFTIFESEFARTLSPVEYDIINSWKDNGFTDELISLALKEAIFNGAPSLKYIDRILNDWYKKGIKNADDVEKEHKKFQAKKTGKKEVFSYDWLNDEE